MSRSRSVLSVTTMSITAGILALVWTVMGGPFWVFIGCFLLAFFWKVFEYGLTPLLHRAAREGRPDAARLLITAGAKLECKNKDGYTPLHKAADLGHSDVTKVLIKAGANLNAAAKNGMTPLHLVASQGHRDVVQILIHAGADRNATNKDGMTPLYMAVFLGKRWKTSNRVHIGF